MSRNFLFSNGNLVVYGLFLFNNKQTKYHVNNINS